MATPTLSVIIPNYNHGKFLPRSLGALVAQSAQPLEIIVIDDASTDDSVKVIQEFAAKYPVIRFIRNEKNRGALASGLDALKAARGEYVCFTAADDQVMPGFFEKSLGILAHHPEAGVCCAATTLFEPHTGLEWQLGAGMADKPRYFSPQDLVELEQTKRVFLPGNTTIWHRSRLLAIGAFRGDFKWHADTFVIHVLAFRHGICYVPDVMGYVQVEPNSYFQKGRKDKAVHRALLEHIMAVLTSPEFEKEAELMGQAGTFYRLEGCILSVLWRNKSYRKFITWPFLKKHLWYSLQVKLKPYTPAFIGNLYLKLVGYRAK